LDPRELFNDSQVIEPQAVAATRAVANLLGGIPEMGPEKDLYRVLHKFSGKDGKDPSYNCDFSRSRVLLRNKAQAKEAMNIFSGPGTVQLRDGTILKIREVENNLSKINDKKAGLPNLDVKLTFEFTTAEGETSFHHHELHFIFKKAKADYDRSHDAYKAKRVAQMYRDGADNALSICGEQDAQSWGKKWNQYDAEVKEAQAKRWEIHNKIRADLGLDELIGYQPCVTSKAKKLANPGTMLYVIS
ncbi:MAG TPA: hypothetical protein VGD95_03715, partial [Micavibrio sp.]